MKTKHSQNLFRAVAGALVCLSGPAGAATILGGDGVGFDDSPIPWVSTVVFDKQDAKPGAPEFVVRTGDDVTPPNQKLTKAQILVPSLSATSWCDSYANPQIPNNEDFDLCYGNASKSNWYVLDLNALQKAGLKGVWVSATARRVDAAADNPLIPALTVWQGVQGVGSNLGWFPQVFQATPAFWASRLTPFTGGSTQSSGWATAYDTASQDMAQVTGWIKLKPGDQNFLTLSVGGDARKHTVKQTTYPDLRYALVLSVSRKKPEPAAPGLLASETQAAENLPSTEKPIVAQPRFVSNGVDITLTNNLYETIQYKGDDDGDNWTDLKPSESYENTGASTFLYNSITTTSFNTSHGSGDIQCINYYIGYPSCNVTLPNHGDWSDAGYFSEGESFSITVDGWSYTLTRHTDGDGFAGSKKFELVIKDTAPSPTPTPTPVPTYTLTVTSSSGGTTVNPLPITSTPTGITCSQSCSGQFTSGTQVKLKWEDAQSHAWAWDGCESVSSDNSECTVTMNAGKSVKVWYSASPTPTPAPTATPQPTPTPTPGPTYTLKVTGKYKNCFR